MGYMCHHAIVVTSWDDELLEKAHRKACKLGSESEFIDGMNLRNWADLVSPIMPSIINGYGTFIVVPDGSKEGWDTSDLGDAFRELFCDWLDAQRYDDFSNSLTWIEVQYGDDAGDNRIIRDGDAIPEDQLEE